MKVPKNSPKVSAIIQFNSYLGTKGAEVESSPRMNKLIQAPQKAPANWDNTYVTNLPVLMAFP